MADDREIGLPERGMAEVARDVSAQSEAARSRGEASGERRASWRFLVKGGAARRRSRMPIGSAELERKIGQQTMEIDCLKKASRRFREHPSASRRQWRHRLYEQIQEAAKSWERQLGSPPQCSSAAMSFQSVIPWRVALRQSLPPLHRLVTILNNPLCRTMIFQRTATTPLTSCLTPRVHFSRPSSPPHPRT